MVDTATATASLPLRAGHLPMHEVIDLYMGEYAGRDTSRVQRLTWWRNKLHGIALQDVSDDHIHAALEELGQQTARFYAGKDADGKPIYKAKKKPLAPATSNRYRAAAGAVFTWAIKRRVAPKGFIHPCRSIEHKPENNAKVRFLSDAERARVLEACKAQSWPLLYPLVVMALTTGARKGELLALRWGDVDLERGVAVCARSKNGDAKALPLVPAVVELLKGFAGAPGRLLFPSPRNPAKPFAFEGQWRDALRQAKVKDFVFHDLRHSCASMLAASGATLLEIADVLGHRDLKMTRRYSHLTTQHKAALVTRVLGGIK